MKKTITFFCKICGKEYESHKSNSIACSPKCGREADRIYHWMSGDRRRDYQRRRYLEKIITNPGVIEKRRERSRIHSAKQRAKKREQA